MGNAESDRRLPANCFRTPVVITREDDHIVFRNSDPVGEEPPVVVISYSDSELKTLGLGNLAGGINRVRRFLEKEMEKKGRFQLGTDRPFNDELKAA